MAYSAGLSVFTTSLIQDEAGATDAGSFVAVGPCTVEQFGGVCGETGTANATKAVYSLELRDAAGGNAVEKATITIPDSLVVGSITFSKSSVFPLKVSAGQIVALKHKTAAGGAGGATYPYIVYREDGYVDAKITAAQGSIQAVAA